MFTKMWQVTATAEEQCKDSTDPDRRRFVGQQNRRSWHRNIFQVDILKRSDCCAEARNNFGSCFLAKVDVTDASLGELRLNTDPGSPLVYLLTAAHNLYCRKHAKYAESIDLVRVKPGQHIQGKESLLKQPVTCVTSDGGRGSFFRVSSFYKIMDGGHQAKTKNFGIICVARDLFHDPQLVASTCLNLQGPVEEQYPVASVCGFPMYITRNRDAGIDIPPSEYEPEVPPYLIPPYLNVAGEGRSKTEVKFYVAGALYEMPAPPSTSLIANGGMQERRLAERSSAGLFAFPQMHFDELAPEIIYRTDDNCRQRLYRHYIDTSGGQSGSPVYIVDDAGYVTVVGIHVGIWFYTANAHGQAKFNPDTDCNIAVRLTNRMLLEVIHLTGQEPHPDNGSVAADRPRQVPVPVPQPRTRRRLSTPPTNSGGIGDLFNSEEYCLVRMELIEHMDFSVRNSAEGFSLITSGQRDRLHTTFTDRSDHNRELFRMMEAGGPATIKKFSDTVLVRMGPNFAMYKARLDALLA